MEQSECVSWEAGLKESPRCLILQIASCSLLGTFSPSNEVRGATYKYMNDTMNETFIFKGGSKRRQSNCHKNCCSHHYSYVTLGPAGVGEVIKTKSPYLL